MGPHANPAATESDFPPANLPENGAIVAVHGYVIPSHAISTGWKPWMVAIRPTPWDRDRSSSGRNAKPEQVTVPLIVAAPVLVSTLPVGFTVAVTVGAGGATSKLKANEPPVLPTRSANARIEYVVPAAANRTTEPGPQ